jgi:molecular chaperone DnaK
VLIVSAKDKGTGKEQKITITGSSTLSEEEIERMVKEAEMHKAEDEKRKALIEAKNQADALIYQTEKSLGEVGDKLDADTKADIQRAIDDLKETLKKEDVTKEEIDTKVKTLTDSSHKLAEAIYQKEQAAQGGANAGAQNNNAKKDDDDVIDAEVE